MKAVVISDSHKNFNSILRIMEKETDVSLMIHAGDVQQDVEDAESVWPTLPIAAVAGNNEYYVLNVPSTRLFTYGGKKIFLTHGHLYGVKQSTARVIAEAEKAEADICIFGHTHRPHLEKVRNLWVLNPGASSNSYATLEIQGDDILITLKEN